MNQHRNQDKGQGNRIKDKNQSSTNRVEAIPHQWKQYHIIRGIMQLPTKNSEESASVMLPHKTHNGSVIPRTPLTTMLTTSVHCAYTYLYFELLALQFYQRFPAQSLCSGGILHCSSCCQPPPSFVGRDGFLCLVLSVSLLDCLSLAL